ncbi:hypothetical protein Godav_023476 [Gossypium davidsonii]|uniref:Uncharacterized protein n=2 Tax=Gossypium TaxID=3633 RepID=A0A7J8SRU7_GOSDV|nr:hypothetical protein [Gossypium davidsonii]MBA0664510.1 hypothetical protein [Gossypium klotzschianum]
MHQKKNKWMLGIDSVKQRRSKI